MSLNVHPDEIVKSSKNGLLAKHPSWGRIRVGEFAEIRNGFAFKSKLFNTQGNGIPIVRIRDVGAPKSETFYDGEFDDDYWVEPGDLLIGMDGDFRIARWRGPRSLLNQRVCRLRVIDIDQYDDRFLEHVLQGYLDAIHERTSSVTVKHLSSRTVAQIPVPHPPLDEQLRIVGVIEEQFSRLDAGVESLQRANRNLDRMRASVLKAATDGELVGPTRGSWETATIREVAIRVDYGSSAKAYADIEGVPMLRMGNIRDGKIVLEDLKFLPSDHPDAEKFSLSAGDVLFNRTNSAELVGKSAVATGQHEGMSFASYLIRLRFGPAVVPEFVVHVINGPLGRAYVARVRSQQVGQANVNGTKLAALPLPIPPIEQQRKIVAEVDRQFSLIDAAEAAVRQGVARAGMLRQSVLLESFSGGVRPGSSGSVIGAT